MSLLFSTLLFSTLLFSTLALAPSPVEIPAGTYTQGADLQPDAPPREVSLSGFRVDVTEVSIHQFEAWVTAGAYGESSHWSPAGRDWLKKNPTGLGVETRAAGRSAEHPVVG
ncbi:MAG: sulfatase activating formylglycine-generating enzyme, partial [Cognaticolwellia sp.]